MGALPRDPTRYAPTYEDYRRQVGQLPVVLPTATIDRAANVTSWPMYCNNDIGDCTFAGIAHVLSAMCVYAGKPLPLFTDAEIIKAYSAVSGYNPVTGANDNGATLQAVLDYVKSNGITDEAGKLHKVVAYAELKNPTDPTMLGEVVNTFGAGYIAINCPQSAQTQFGGLWEWEPDSPIEGGHCIGLHYRAPIAQRVLVSFSTWGALQAATAMFVSHYVTEAIAVVSEDWIEANGESCEQLDLAQLVSDMQYV